MVKSTQPVSATKTERTAKRRESLFCSGCLPSLKTETVRLAGLSAHSCLALELGLEVHRCTAAWLMGEGRRRKAEEKRERGGEAVGPALPALGPALASNCNSSSGGTVSSAWLPLTSPPTPPASSPVAPAWIQKPPFSSVFSLILSPVPDLKTIRNFSRRSEELVPLLLRSPSALRCLPPRPNDESLRLHGVNT